MRQLARLSSVGALAALAAGALAGCGAAGAAHPAPRTTRVADHVTASRAPADHVPAVRVSAKVRAQEAAIHRTVAASLRAGARSKLRYGGIPADLRHRQAAPRDQVLSASPGHPAEPITGVAVRLHEAGGSALALAVGPYVPLRDQGSFRNHTSATWRVTFSDVRGEIALRPAMFTLTDEQGQTLVPRVSVLGGGRLPAAAPAGRSLTVVLAARTSIGAGTLSFTPGGTRFLAAWDFDAETD